MMEIQCDFQEPESPKTCFSCFRDLVKLLINALIILVMALIGLTLLIGLIVLLVECCAYKGPWIIIASSNHTRKDAIHEYNKAQNNQLTPTLYLRNDRYRTTIGLFATQQEADAKLPRIKKVMRKDAYVVNLIDWCPLMTTRQDRVIICQ